MKKALVLALAVMLAATSAWAYNDALHVKTAPNGKGDLLIFPVYFTANGGWQTKITVINTSGQYSTVAKVVLHSHYYSQELLDFLLYLTPNDVWTGTLVNDGTNVYIQSTDDSALAPNGLFASASNPMNQVITQATCISSKQATVYANDSNAYGYIEVVEAWFGDLASTYYTTTNLKSGENASPPQVTKAYLKRVYDKWVASTACTDCKPYSGVGNDFTINILTGFFELQNALVSGYNAGMRATVMADWDNNGPLTTQAATGFMGNAARNNVGEIEAALAKQDLAMPYVNQSGNFTIHIMTFPTKGSKYSTDSSSYCRYTNGFAGNGFAGALFWYDSAVSATNPYASTEYRCVPYSLVNYDLTEMASASGPYSGVVATNSMCEEVNLLTNSPNGFGVSQPISIFDEGWSRYNFTRTTALRFPTLFNSAIYTSLSGFPDHSYYGAPVIPVVLFGKNGSMSFMEGAYSDGAVYGELLSAGTSDPNAGGTYGRLSARNNAVAAAEGAWPYARYQWPTTGSYAGNATGYNNTAGIVPTYCIVGGANICTWLPEYQYSNEINELGIVPPTSTYPTDYIY